MPTSGRWSANERVGIPPIRVTDGPNGARGSALFGLGGETAVCVPCGSALGATWDPELVERVGAMLGEEARTKACRVLLAPTVNIHRSPLAGRNFECYSEDPLLSGKTAAAFVRGVQSQGVVTTVKHFAGNDAEFERHTINSVIDERTLRELYLVPFELAVREGGALGIMTAYNRLNGPHCSEHARSSSPRSCAASGGSTGFVLTDWFERGSTVGSSAAGLDLEMPGPGRFYGPPSATRCAPARSTRPMLDAHGRATCCTVFDRRRRARRPADGRAVDRPARAPRARAGGGDRGHGAAAQRRRPAVRPSGDAHAGGPRTERRAGADHGRRLRQPRAALPDQPARRAARQRRATASTSRYERGCRHRPHAPPLAGDVRHRLLRRPRARAGPVVGTADYRDGRLLLFDPPPARGRHRATSRSAPPRRYVPDETGTHTFALVQIGGRARVLVDGEVVLDGVADPARSRHRVLRRSAAPRLEAAGRARRRATRSRSSSSSPSVDGVFLRGRAGRAAAGPSPPDLIDRAVAAAAAADAVDRGRRHQRRLGDRGRRPRLDGPARATRTS